MQYQTVKHISGGLYNTEGLQKEHEHKHTQILTETVELGVLVPYPEDGREARDQRRPSVLKVCMRERWKSGLDKLLLVFLQVSGPAEINNTRSIQTNNNKITQSEQNKALQIKILTVNNDN